jgi:hypothetical protein
MYTDECLEQMVAQFKQKVSNGVQMFGELGYPESTSFTSLERVSHQVENLQVEGDTLFAEIKVLDTPRGKELKTLLDDIVFRPRMIGHVLEDNTVRVDNLISFDAILKETDSYKDIL